MTCPPPGSMRLFRRRLTLAALAVCAGLPVARATLDPLKPPGGNFDLSHWKLTLPVDLAGGTSGKASEVMPPALGGYARAPYFATASDGSMIFWAPVDGATTDGSTYPRSELRELLDPGDDNVNWTTAGTHVLGARCEVREKPSTGKVIIGQIHGFSGEARPLIKLQYANGVVDALIKHDPAVDTDTHYPFSRNFALGASIDYEIRVADGVLGVTVGGEAKSVALPKWAGETLYFKAGAYCQDNSGASSEGALVAFQALTVTHGAAAPGLDPAKAPSGNFDLSHWNLTIPVDAAGGNSGTASTVATATLANGSYQRAPYFFTATDGAMVFGVPADGAISGTSEHPRAELRELRDPASAAVNWTAEGAHRLAADCVVEAVGAGVVCIGQIHGKSPNIPLVLIRFDNRGGAGVVTASVKYSPDGAANPATGRTDETLTFGAAGDVGLGNAIHYEMALVDGAVSVTVNGETRTADLLAAGTGWENVTFYFKAGAYYVGPDPDGAAARVAFYKLAAEHDGFAIARAEPEAAALGKGSSRALGATGGALLVTGEWIQAADRTDSLTWSVSDGAAPPGMSLTSAGVLQGAPTAAGVYDFTVTARDAARPAAAASRAITLLVAENPAVPVRETFADAERSAQAPPGSLAWFTSGAAGGVAVGAGGLKLTPDGSRQLAAYFPRRALAVGESLHLLVEFSVAAPLDLGGGLRMALLDSRGGARIGADAVNPSLAYAGYGSFTNLAPTAANPLALRRRNATANVLITSTSSWTSLGAGGAATVFAPGETYVGVLTVRRTAAGAVAVAQRFSGGEIADYRVEKTDAAAPTASFDTVVLAIGSSSGVPAVADIRFSLVSLVHESPAGVAPLAAYLAARGLDPETTAGSAGADPDGDGLINRWEFVIGGDPLAPTGPGWQSAAMAGAERFRYAFDRTKASAAENVRVERSADLQTWETLANGVGGVVFTATPLDAERDRVTVELPWTGARCFVRLRAGD